MWHLLPPVPAENANTLQNTDTTFTEVTFGLWARCPINKDLTLEVKLPRSEADGYQILDTLVEHNEIRFGLPAAILHDLVSVGLKKSHTVLLETQLRNNPDLVLVMFEDYKTQFSGCNIRAIVPDNYHAVEDNLGLVPQRGPVPFVVMTSKEFKDSCKKLDATDNVVFFEFRSTVERFSIKKRIDDDADDAVYTRVNEKRFNYEDVAMQLDRINLVEIAKACVLSDSVIIYAYSGFVRFLFEGTVLISYNLNASTVLLRE